jgi:colanic acid/amylovoran biosynthesis protein
MLDQTSAEDAEHYLRLLQFAVGFFRDAGLPSVVVLHDANEDRQVLPALFARTGKLPVIEHSDPRCLKGVLGKAHVLVGSRYHALVSALSQAVPCIGAGWAHKYQWLFNDYDCDECLLELRRSEEYLAQALARVCDAERRRELIGRLSGRSDWIRRQVEQMWRRVSQMISLAWLWREVRP